MTGLCGADAQLDFGSNLGSSLRRVSHPNLLVDLKYAGSENVLGRPFSDISEAILHPDAAACLERAASRAARLGYHLLLFDAWRPPAAQQALWEACPDPDFVCPPDIGSNHTRGVAVDVSLRAVSGNNLDMGTGFDEFRAESRHSSENISDSALKNRRMLCGLMTASGWQAYEPEWWHYELKGARDYPLILSPFGS